MYRLINGESIATLAAAKPESIDAIVCDPPYAIEFMGKGWDSPRMLGAATGVSGGFQGIPAGTPRPDISNSDPLLFQQWCTAWGEQAMRVLKPGGHLAAFGSPRTAHRLAAGLEDAGFEVRDTIMWLYGEGMPKGRSLVEQARKEGLDDPEALAGFQTCLKPMFEPVTVLRKPLAPGVTPTGRVSKKPMSVAKNMTVHGTGALNVAAGAVGDEERTNPPAGNQPGGSSLNMSVAGMPQDAEAKTASGRMPGNAIVDEVVAGELESERKGRSRYFYCGKVRPAERRAGLEEGDAKHPTCKPIALMEYLVRLVCPPGGVVLDPFMGSGSTGIAALTQGFNFVGIELDASYVVVAQKRIAHWAPEQLGQVVTGVLPAPPVEEGAIVVHEAQAAEGVTVAVGLVDPPEPAAEQVPNLSFDIYCANVQCGEGIDLGREVTAEDKAMAWHCGACAAAVAAVTA